MSLELLAAALCCVAVIGWACCCYSSCLNCSQASIDAMEFDLTIAGVVNCSDRDCTGDCEDRNGTFHFRDCAHATGDDPTTCLGSGCLRSYGTGVFNDCIGNDNVSTLGFVYDSDLDQTTISVSIQVGTSAIQVRKVVSGRLTCDDLTAMSPISLT
ncbi:MAG TPA: hypothetical protein VG713_15260, partial [Pirellulales bacterium]|nr:hypothetical protein [Pirellulales bacterium]